MNIVSGVFSRFTTIFLKRQLLAPSYMLSFTDTGLVIDIFMLKLHTIKLYFNSLAPELMSGIDHATLFLLPRESCVCLLKIACPRSDHVLMPLGQWVSLLDCQDFPLLICKYSPLLCSMPLVLKEVEPFQERQPLLKIDKVNSTVSGWHWQLTRIWQRLFDIEEGYCSAAATPFSQWLMVLLDGQV